MYRNFRSQTSILLDTCIAIIMYCQRLFCCLHSFLGDPIYPGADPRGCMGCCSTPPDSSVQILLCINHC